jgi:UDPglucose 6-dehydrogenase
MNEKIGIIGIGMVGGALKEYFDKQGQRLFLYDKGKNIGSIEEANCADIVFICVPTPYNGSFDLSIVKEACGNLKEGKIVVIKSTVIPGTTELLQEEFSNHKLLFNPEFLVEEKAVEDMFNPDRQIVGYTNKSKDIARKVMQLLPKAPYERIIPATESEMIKYFGNNFLSVKVIFGVEMYRLCKKLNIDYDTVREGASADPRIGRSHLDVFHGGYQGYGGKCLPKDIRALIELADKLKVDLRLHKMAEEINNQVMEEQGIKDPENRSQRE